MLIKVLKSRATNFLNRKPSVSHRVQFTSEAVKLYRANLFINSLNPQKTLVTKCFRRRSNFIYSSHHRKTQETWDRYNFYKSNLNIGPYCCNVLTKDMIIYQSHRTILVSTRHCTIISRSVYVYIHIYLYIFFIYFFGKFFLFEKTGNININAAPAQTPRHWNV